MSKENWLEKSRVAIDNIYSEEPNESNVLLLGALLTITECEESSRAIMTAPYETPAQIVNSLLVNKSLRELVDDELSDAEMYTGMNEYDIARDELRHADRFLSVLKAQVDKHSLQELIERRHAIAAKL